MRLQIEASSEPDETRAQLVAGASSGDAGHAGDDRRAITAMREVRAVADGAAVEDGGEVSAREHAAETLRLAGEVERADLFFDCGFTVDGEIFAPRAGEQVTLTGDRRLTFVRA